MINQNWGALVKKHFYCTLVNLPAIGDLVTGIVVANAPFGIWLDIDAGIPGLLLIPELNPTKYPAKNYPEWMPEIGEEISATVVWFKRRPMPEIYLSQKPTNQSIG